MKLLLPLLALALVLFAGCGGDDIETEQYSAELRAIGGSGVTGRAVFRLEDDAIDATITAKGLEERQIVSQFVKGLAGTEQARCPESVQFAGGGQVAYGKTVLALEPFPTVQPGRDVSRYDGRLPLSEAERRRIEPLERRVLLITGEAAQENGGGRRNTPVACGEISTSE